MSNKSNDLIKIFIEKLIWHKALVLLGDNIVPKILSLCLEYNHLQAFVSELSNIDNYFSETDQQQISDLVNLVQSIYKECQKHPEAKQHLISVAQTLTKMNALTEVMRSTLDHDTDKPEDTNSNESLAKACDRLRKNLNSMQFGGGNWIKFAATTDLETLDAFCDALRTNGQKQNAQELIAEIIEDFQYISKNCQNNEQNQQFVCEQALIACEINATKNFFSTKSAQHD